MGVTSCCTNTCGSCYGRCDSHYSCSTSAHACGCCNPVASACGNISVNAINNSYSTKEMENQKTGIVYEQLQLLKPLVNIDIQFPYQRANKEDGSELQLLEGVTKPELRSLFKRTKSFSLSTIERKSLYQTLLAGVSSTNNMSLLYNVQTELAKVNLSVDTSIVLRYINISLESCMGKLLCYSQFGPELNNYSFTQLFNLFYKYLQLSTFYFRPKLIFATSQRIQYMYGLPTTITIGKRDFVDDEH